MVQQTARGGNQHIDTAVDQLVLFFEAHSTDQQGFGKFTVFCVGVEIFGHLCRQFPSRAKHQAARHSGTCAAKA